MQVNPFQERLGDRLFLPAPSAQSPGGIAMVKAPELIDNYFVCYSLVGLTDANPTDFHK